MIKLVIPELEDYWFEKEMQSDPKTMSYNAGWDVDYYGYHYDTCCIDFPKERWEDKYKERKGNNNVFFAYLLDTKIDKYIGYVNYRINDKNECHIGVLVKHEFRGKGYGLKGLKLLCSWVFRHNIDKVYDSIEYSREKTRDMFKKIGFIDERETTYKRFGKEEKGSILSLTKKDYINIELNKIKTPEDILEFMDNIGYGYIDKDGIVHYDSLKGFRKIYRTSSVEMVLDKLVGTCIEQVYLMKYLLDKLNIPNKMYCTRIYEGKDFNDLEADEHMHCFIIYYLNNKVYHIEHPNPDKVGIYEYNTEEEAVKTINDYYIELSGGMARPLTEFKEIKEGLSFKEFNDFINSIDGGIYERN